MLTTKILKILPAVKNGSEEEKRTLCKLASRFLRNHYEEYDRDRIAEELNKIFGNNRTSSACSQKFYKLHGDNYK